MHHTVSSRRLQVTGKWAAWSVCCLEIAYAIITTAGFLSLPSPDDPIGDPYFTVMELLIIVIVPLMLATMSVVHLLAPEDKKIWSLLALLFMAITTGMTTQVHFILLTVGDKVLTAGLEGTSFLLSFTWPSVVYALDILAWDWFFALSMLCAAPVFSEGRLEKRIRRLMILSGLLSLAGLLGIPFDNMQVRNIGIIGYGVVAPFIFFFLGMLYWKNEITPTPSRRE